MLVRGTEDLIVDLAVDSPPGRPATASILGPTYAPEELAGRKLLALFDRAAARDFVDVFALVNRYGKQALLEQALVIVAGFDHGVLSQALATLVRYGRPHSVGNRADVGCCAAMWRQPPESRVS